MKYILIEFIKGLSGTGYQVINERMECVGYVDMAGQAIVFDDNIPVESKVIDPEPKEIQF